MLIRSVYINLIMAVGFILVYVSCNNSLNSTVNKEQFTSDTSQFHYFAGLRRSHYGYSEKHQDDAFWANLAMEIADNILFDQAIA